MDVIRPGTHGSTFGGNPLAAAVGQRSLEVLLDEHLAERAARLGRDLIDRLQSSQLECVRAVRGRGLLVGIEIHRAMGPARRFCERLLELGVLCKDTHEQVIRLAPPLTLESEHIEWLVERLQTALSTCDKTSGS